MAEPRKRLGLRAPVPDFRQEAAARGQWSGPIRDDRRGSPIVASRRFQDVVQVLAVECAGEAGFPRNQAFKGLVCVDLLRGLGTNQAHRDIRVDQTFFSNSAWSPRTYIRVLIWESMVDSL